jgi:SAM-dependent methyltransferase
MSQNFLFLLDFCKNYYHKKHLKILDYGCGNGELIKLGEKKGFNFYGVDISFPHNTKNLLIEEGYFDRNIKQLVNELIPFSSDFFDIVVSNNVIEHVADLDLVLAEISRVLKVGGIFIALFPVKETFIEWHLRIPFAHWFNKGTNFRLYFGRVLRQLGMGTHKDYKGLAWSKLQFGYLDNCTNYRSRKVIFSTFSKYFQMKSIEAKYISFRWKSIGKLTKNPYLRIVISELYRRFLGLVVMGKKIE